mgnify:CR=1 FL=1
MVVDQAQHAHHSVDLIVYHHDMFVTSIVEYQLEAIYRFRRIFDSDEALHLSGVVLIRNPSPYEVGVVVASTEHGPTVACMNK